MEMIKYQEMVIQRHFAISYSLYSCLIFPSRGSIHLKKKIKKKISWSGSSHIRLLQLPPQLNKVTLCWTLRWHSLFMCLMNWILKGQTAHMLHSGRNQSMFKNSDKRLSRVSERCKIYMHYLSLDSRSLPCWCCIMQLFELHLKRNIWQSLGSNPSNLPKLVTPLERLKYF